MSDETGERATPIRLDLDALYEKVEETDSRYAFPFDTATTKATFLLLIRRVDVAEANAERLTRQYDRLTDEYDAQQDATTRCLDCPKRADEPCCDTPATTDPEGA